MKRMERVADIQARMETTRLKFGDQSQIESLEILRRAEELIGKERWDNYHQRYETYERSAVYTMTVDALMNAEF